MFTALVLCALFCLSGAVYAQQAGSGAKAAADVGYLEDIRFEKLPVKERVTVTVSRQAGVRVESTDNRAVVMVLENVFVPEDLRKAFGEGKLSNIVRVTPVQKREGSRQWANLTIDLKERVPYSVRQEGNQVVLDFNVAALASAPSPAPAGMAASKRQAAASASASVELPVSAPTQTGARASGQKISVDFQDADIRAVLRLLSEQSGKNIVVSPDVKGSLTISMKNVPWEQVLDTILTINSLVKKEQDNVITVMTFDKVKKDETDRRTSEDARVKAEEIMRESWKRIRAEQGKSRQIIIEAKIVEVTDSFTRDLGTLWTGQQSGTMGNSGYSYGLLGGTTGSSATTLSKLTTGVALTQDALALNLASSAAPFVGFVVGGSNAVLSAKISAAQTTGQGKVISAPRVLIADDEKAIIEQGEQIPVTTAATATTPATTTYKDAVLRLEVRPKIIADDYLLLTIQAKKDQANRALQDPATGNMPIDTSKIDSKVAIRNGDTIVIGGVKKTDDSKTVTGVPWLSNIPILGWLFKTESIVKSSKELLIFVTPRIINKSGVPEVAEKKG